MRELRGVGVALVTPFTESGDVDFGALTALLDHTDRVDYYVVMGTTAENVTLSQDEKHAVVRHVVAHNQGRKPIVVGVGGNNTKDVLCQLESFDLTDVDAILSVVPYYNKPSQEGIYQHYAAILRNSPLPVILYNVPGRTGVNMSAATTLRLACDFPRRAIGVKEASGNMSQVAYILRDRPDGFLVISGDDNSTLPLIALGGDGVISVSANVFTSAMCDMTHLALNGRIADSAIINLRLLEATDLLFVEGNPVGAKAALSIKGVMGNYLRLPLVSSSKGLEIKLKEQIQKYDL